jgi:hypothetical protein
LSNEHRMLFIIALSVVTYPIALGFGYLWVRAMHYPLTVRQRRIWTYYVLIVSAFPVLATLTVAMGLWMLSAKGSAVIALFLLVVWIVIAQLIVRRMSRPGGRLGNPHQAQD